MEYKKVKIYIQKWRASLPCSVYTIDDLLTMLTLYFGRKNA